MKRRSKILLIPAPSVDSAGYLRPYFPLGLLSLRALSTEAKLPEVEVWLPTPESLPATPLASSAELAEAVIDSIPDLDDIDAVGLSTMCSSFHHSIVLAQKLKERRADLALWMGGPQASLVADILLEAVPEVDAVIVGEGEGSFADILEGWPGLQGIPGAMTREGGLTTRPPLSDLDELPQVDVTVADIEVLHRQRPGGIDKAAMPIEVTRGCPGGCSFCSTRAFWGQRVRRKSDERVIAEMHRLSSATGMRKFEIIGDNFSASLVKLRAFCQTLIHCSEASFFHRAKPLWMCDSRLDRLCHEDLDLLWSAGCRGFFVGVESASQSTLDRLGKTVDLAREIDVIEMALRRGFELKASLIVGFPWESMDDVDQTFQLHSDLLRLGVRECQLWLLCPLPGTPLASQYNIVFDHFGSHIAVDGIAKGSEILELVERFPSMFSQLGRFETPTLDPLHLTSTVETAAQINRLYARSR